MYKQRLCLGLSEGFGLTPEAQLEALAGIGFGGFFTDAKPDTSRALAKRAKELGLMYQSIHAPFGNAARMWSNETCEAASDELIASVRLCAELEVPVTVAHCWIGFDANPGPNSVGIESYGRVVRECEKLGVTLALENTEGEEFLDALMESFEGERAVGFCLDTGHELCYNRGRDMLASYGKRLVATHLNDNLGISDYGGRTYWTDDLHLLPFDGIADWEGIARRLNACDFRAPLTFELSRDSKPNRHENDGYRRLEPIDYLTEVYKRACRVAALRLR